MTSIYAAKARDTYATLREKGGPIVFTVHTGAPSHDEDTDVWTPGTTGSLATRALQLEDDPEKLSQLAAQGIVVADPVTLMVAALSDTGAAVRPVSGMPFTWGGDTCSVKAVEALNLDGTQPIFWTVIGSRGP